MQEILSSCPISTQTSPRIKIQVQNQGKPSPASIECKKYSVPAPATKASQNPKKPELSTSVVKAPSGRWLPPIQGVSQQKISLTNKKDDPKMEDNSANSTQSKLESLKKEIAIMNQWFCSRLQIHNKKRALKAKQPCLVQRPQQKMGSQKKYKGLAVVATAKATAKVCPESYAQILQEPQPHCGKPAAHQGYHDMTSERSSVESFKVFWMKSKDGKIEKLIIPIRRLSTIPEEGEEETSSFDDSEETESQTSFDDENFLSEGCNQCTNTKGAHALVTHMHKIDGDNYSKKIRNGLNVMREKSSTTTVRAKAKDPRRWKPSDVPKEPNSHSLLAKKCR